MKKKLKANAYYMGSILLGVGMLVCASGIEHSEGLVMFGWLAAALVLGSVALGLAAKGLVAAGRGPEGTQSTHRHRDSGPPQRKKGGVKKHEGEENRGS